jgi:hypothetical protein
MRPIHRMLTETTHAGQQFFRRSGSEVASPRYSVEAEMVWASPLRAGGALRGRMAEFDRKGDRQS